MMLCSHFESVFLGGIFSVLKMNTELSILLPFILVAHAGEVFAGWVVFLYQMNWEVSDNCRKKNSDDFRELTSQNCTCDNVVSNLIG